MTRRYGNSPPPPLASRIIVAANREKYALIRDGVPVTFRNDRGERVRERLRVLDFETPENNHFLCVRELWVHLWDQWRDKEATRGAVHVTIRDFLWSDETGLPDGAYSDEEVEARSDREGVARHQRPHRLARRESHSSHNR